MRVRVETLWCAKRGLREEEYEDASSHPNAAELTSSSVRFAVADGATEGMLSGLWARELCEAFVDPAARLIQLNGISLTVKRARSRWPARLDSYKHARDKSGRPLKWYEEEKLQSGAFATFVGASLHSAGGKVDCWAVAVGDSCVMHFRNEQLVSSHPVERSQDFGSSPALVRTTGKLPVGMNKRFELAKGDHLLLMTDAISEWTLRHAKPALHHLDSAILLESSRHEFADWARRRIERGELRNDDLTVLRLRVEET